LLRGNLRDLTRANRWLAGADLSWRALWSVLIATSPSVRLRVLDVGTGAADIPFLMAQRARRAGRSIEIVATDVRPEIVAIAAANVARADVEEVRVRLADPRLADEPDASYDVVHSSLVLHHHDEAQAQALLREMARVARSAVIVNDLDRGWLWWIGAWLLGHLATTNSYTRHDAPLSVKRAYRPDEMSAIARSVGLHEVGRHRSRPGFRYALTFVRGEPHPA
jgi:ubiquinone/menaquinone biosynthesis C-methylase UbiE